MHIKVEIPATKITPKVCLAKTENSTNCPTAVHIHLFNLTPKTQDFENKNNRKASVLVEDIPKAAVKPENNVGFDFFQRQCSSVVLLAAWLLTTFCTVLFCGFHSVLQNKIQTQRSHFKIAFGAKAKKKKKIPWTKKERFLCQENKKLWRTGMKIAGLSKVPFLVCVKKREMLFFLLETPWEALPTVIPEVLTRLCVKKTKDI